MKIIFIALLLASNYFIGFAQSDAIKEIRKHYYGFEEEWNKCAENADNSNCTIRKITYRDTIENNEEYTYDSNYWVYEFYFDENKSTSDKSALLRKIITTHVGPIHTEFVVYGFHTSTEYLFINKALVFSFKENIFWGNFQERCYYKGDKLIRRINSPNRYGDPEIEDYENSTKTVDEKMMEAFFTFFAKVYALGFPEEVPETFYEELRKFDRYN